MLQIKIYIESLGLDMTDRGLRRERDLLDHRRRLWRRSETNNNDDEAGSTHNGVLTNILRGPIAKIVWSLLRATATDE